MEHIDKKKWMVFVMLACYDKIFKLRIYLIDHDLYI